jgi:hypothetical protein
VRAVPPDHPTAGGQPDSNLIDKCEEEETSNYKCELKRKQETETHDGVDVLYTMYSCVQDTTTTACDQIKEYIPCINKEGIYIFFFLFYLICFYLGCSFNNNTCYETQTRCEDYDSDICDIAVSRIGEGNFIFL